MPSEPISFRTIVRGSVVLVGCLIVASYIVYQARFLIVGPQIALSSDLPQAQNERVVTLTGSTANISRLWLNGRPIFTNPEGTFAADVILAPGYNRTTIEAEDRYGRRTTVTEEFVYAPMTFSQSTDTDIN